MTTQDFKLTSWPSSPSGDLHDHVSGPASPQRWRIENCAECKSDGGGRNDEGQGWTCAFGDEPTCAKQTGCRAG